MIHPLIEYTDYFKLEIEIEYLGWGNIEDLDINAPICGLKFFGKVILISLN